MRWHFDRSRTLALMALAMGALVATPDPGARGQEAKNPPASNADMEKRIVDLDETIGQHADAGRIAEAIPPAREKLDLLVRLRGKDHWQAGDARRDVETMDQLAARSRAVQDRFTEARRTMARGQQLFRQGRYAQASELFQQVLAIDREIWGDGHPYIVTTYNNLAMALRNQGKPADAEAIHRRALAIRLKALGERHPLTAMSYGNLAQAVEDQGKYAEAEAMHRQALAIRLKALGEDHVDTALSDNNLAVNLASQGKFAEAEVMYRRALAIFLKALPEGHPNIALSYNNLANTLWDQGKHAEAEAMHRRALAIFLKALPEGHHLIANSYNNLAEALRTQGKPAEAEAMHRRALAIRLKALPEGHPEIAQSYDNLALTLGDQGKLAEAEAMHRRALAIWLKALPEGHPDIATSYGNLAATLRDQGKPAEAEAMLRRALAILLKALPEGHPHIVVSYGSLAVSLDRQGKHDEALWAWHSAAATYELARSFGPRGLETAIRIGSPLPDLATALARAGRPRDAWASWERGLARGVTDEVTRRAARPLTTEERDREAALLGRGQSTDERINKLLAVKALTRDQEKSLDDLRQQAGEVRRGLLELDRQFEDKYGALASRPATLEEARKALPEGTALFGWIDTQDGPLGLPARPFR